MNCPMHTTATTSQAATTRPFGNSTVIALACSDMDPLVPRPSRWESGPVAAYGELAGSRPQRPLFGECR